MAQASNKVADMISVFNAPPTTTPIATPTKGTHTRPNKTPEVTPPTPPPEPHPQTAQTETKIPFKIIHISGSGQVVDEKDPSFSRTLGHFKTGINNNYGPGRQINRGPVIKPMGFQGPTYNSSRKISAPPSLRYNSMPRSKTYENSLSSNITSPSPPLPSPPARPQSQIFTPLEEDHSTTDQRFTVDDDTCRSNSFSVPTTPVVKSIQEPGGIWFPSNNRSPVSSPGRVPSVRTWDKLSSDGNSKRRTTTTSSSKKWGDEIKSNDTSNNGSSSSNVRPVSAANVRRSRSFTSRVSVEVSTGRREQKKSHRSSLALDFGMTPPDVLRGEERARSAMAGSINDKEEEEGVDMEGQYSPSIPLKNFLKDVQSQEKNKVVLSAPISVEVNRIISTFGALDESKDTSSPSNTSPGNRRGSYQYRTLPSRLSGEQRNHSSSQTPTSPKGQRSTTDTAPKVKRSVESTASPKVKRSDTSPKVNREMSPRVKKSTTDLAVSPKVKKSTETSPRVQRSTETSPKVQRSAETSPRVQRSSETSPRVQMSTETSPRVQRSTEASPRVQRSTEASPRVQRSTETATSPRLQTDKRKQEFGKGIHNNFSLKGKKESPKVPPKLHKGKLGSNYITQKSLDSSEILTTSCNESPILQRNLSLYSSPKQSPASSPSFKQSSQKQSPPLPAGGIRSKIALFQSGSIPPPSITQSSTLPRKNASISASAGSFPKWSPQLSVRESIRSTRRSSSNITGQTNDSKKDKVKESKEMLSKKDEDTSIDEGISFEVKDVAHSTNETLSKVENSSPHISHHSSIENHRVDKLKEDRQGEERQVKKRHKVPPTPLPKPQRSVSMGTPPTRDYKPPPPTNEPKVEEEIKEEEEVEVSSQSRLRIHSEKDESSNHDDEIKVELFDLQLNLTQQPSLQQDMPTLTTPTKYTPTNKLPGDQDYNDDVLDSKIPSPDYNNDDETPSPQRPGRYSYQEYTLMRKSLRSSVSGSSISSDTSTSTKLLAVIPENSQSLSTLHDRREESGGEGEGGSDPDSESELVKRMSRVSGTFYEEVFDSIASKLVCSERGGANGNDNHEEDMIDDERVNEVKKRLSLVVDSMVRNDPTLEDQADGLYESLEEYGRKVSDYLLHQRNILSNEDHRDETPPELPPRPDFLLRLIREEREEENDRENDSTPSILQMNEEEEYDEVIGVGGEENEFNTYEPNYREEIIKSPSKKKSRKTSKLPFKRKVPSEESINDSIRPTSPLLPFKEDVKSFRKLSKRKWKIPGRSVKIEPTSSLPSRSTSVVERPLNYERMISSATPPPPHSYVNVNGRSMSVSASRPHPPSSYEPVEVIPPTYSSESETEEMGGVCDSSMNSGSSFSPTKIRWKDETAPPQTPDSSVFQPIDSRALNPMTPPLFTKLTVNMTTPTRQYLRTSTSDPSLHSTSLHMTTLSHRMHPVSPTPSPCGELSIDSIDMASTPSVCSYDSNHYYNGGGLDKTSPAVMRKRVRSDASDDRVANKRGAQQKAQLLLAAQRRKRRGSLPGSNSSTEGVIEVPLVYADALTDCTGMEQDHLSFKVNDVIAVLDMRDDDWWQGIVEDRIGWFSASWVRLRINQDGGDNSSLDRESDYDHSSSNSSSFRLPKSDSNPDTTTCNNTIETTGIIETTTGTTDDEGIHVGNTEQDTVPELNHGESSTGRKSSVVTRRRTIRKRDSGDLPRSLSPAEIRAKCIEEILHTERVYVNHLQDIVEGFLYPCQQRSQLFDEERIETIFCNIEDIYIFQQEFLQMLESRIDSSNLGDSLIGDVFVLMKDKFSMYSEYCNNHPHAVNEMNLLHQDQQYTLFFEGCRLLRNMTDISLTGFLLNPVQRICRYPLQLSELLKYTPETHADYCHVLAAQDAMTQVAILINERKRRMEGLGRVKNWQDSVENWKGSDLLDRSTELVYGGELHKISKGHTQERHFFLFDHQLVYCKKDAIGAKLSYKGRVNTDKCEIIDIKDNEVQGGSSLKNAWKINNVDKDDKWYILFAKTPQVKQDWMDAFKRERELVKEDESNNFFITPKMKRAAIAMFNPSSETIGRRHQAKKDWASESTPVSLNTVSRTRYDTFSGSKSLNYSPVEKKRKYNKRK